MERERRRRGKAEVEGLGSTLGMLLEMGWLRVGEASWNPWGAGERGDNKRNPRGEGGLLDDD